MTLHICCARGHLVRGNSSYFNERKNFALRHLREEAVKYSISCLGLEVTEQPWITCKDDQAHLSDIVKNTVIIIAINTSTAIIISVYVAALKCPFLLVLWHQSLSQLLLRSSLPLCLCSGSDELSGGVRGEDWKAQLWQTSWFSMFHQGCRDKCHLSGTKGTKINLNNHLGYFWTAALILKPIFAEEDVTWHAQTSCVFNLLNGFKCTHGLTSQYLTSPHALSG